MIQFIFFVDGLRQETDEAAALECAKRIFPTCEIKADALTSSLTINAEQEVMTDEATACLAEDLKALGYTLKMPPSSVAVQQTPIALNEKDEPRKKQRKRPSWLAFVASTCALLIVAILATNAVTSARFGQKIKHLQEELLAAQDKAEEDDVKQDPTQNSGYVVPALFPELEVFEFLFDQYAIEDIDQEALERAVLKAYVQGTGDLYAEYYTAEELEMLDQENQGNFEGIGVSIVNDKVIVDGFSYQVLTVTNVFHHSPAFESDVRIGDHIYTVTDADGVSHTVGELGYDRAIACVRGPAGSNAEFSSIRIASNGDYEVIPFSITRASVTAETVTSRVSSLDPTIAIVKISQFDLTTPGQFRENMDACIEQGCTKFIFDVRYNPGGMIISIEAILSMLLEEGDLMISTTYKDGSQEFDYVKPVTYPEEYSTCSVSREDIGIYSGYEFAVLTNEYTASAAELFAANMRDHELAMLIGETTYGKGCMQSTIDLEYFGYEGALKLTVAWYQPPCGINYHGVGIEPHVFVETDDALIEQYGNIYLIPDELDPQINAAIETLNQ